MFEKKDFKMMCEYVENNERKYLIDNFIAENTVNFITGPSTVGKTTVIYSLAKTMADSCLPIDENWLGFNVNSGRVLIFDNEMGMYEATATMKALSLMLRDRVDYIEDQFIDIKNKNEVSGFYSYISNEVKESDLKLVIIDSLSACCGNLDENSNSDMRLFMEFLDKLSEICTVFVIHHKGKNFEHEFRGASVIKDRADNFLVMDKAGEIKITKNRNGKFKDTKISFNYVEDGEYVRLEVDEANSNGFQPKKTLSETILLNLEDGMNQTQLFQKMRANGERFVNEEVRKTLKSSTKIDMKKGDNNSSIYYHKK